jgi:hypothetical protein
MAGPTFSYSHASAADFKFLKKNIFFKSALFPGWGQHVPWSKLMHFYPFGVENI